MHDLRAVRLGKIVYSALLPLFVFAGVTFLPEDVTFAALFAGALLHVLPYVFTLILLKSNHPKTARGLIFGDFLRVVCPSIAGCLVGELILLLAYGPSQYRGLVTMMLGIIYLLLWCVYSAVYFLLIRRYNRSFR